MGAHRTSQHKQPLIRRGRAISHAHVVATGFYRCDIAAILHLCHSPPIRDKNLNWLDVLPQHWSVNSHVHKKSHKHGEEQPWESVQTLRSNMSLLRHSLHIHFFRRREERINNVR